jgi:hypothetical protein
MLWILNAMLLVLLFWEDLFLELLVLFMKEGTIRYQFPLKKGMEHFPRKRKKLPFDSTIRTNYDVDACSLENTLFLLSALR